MDKINSIDDSFVEIDSNNFEDSCYLGEFENDESEKLKEMCRTSDNAFSDIQEELKIDTSNFDQTKNSKLQKINSAKNLEFLTVLNERKKQNTSLVNVLKENKASDEIQRKIEEKNASIKKSFDDDDYNTNINDVLKVLSQKNQSTIMLSKTHKDKFELKDVVNYQKSKHSAAVNAVNSEDNKSLDETEQIKTNKLNSVYAKPESSYKNINDTNNLMMKQHLHESNSETQMMLDILKNNKKDFMNTILDY